MDRPQTRARWAAVVPAAGCGRRMSKNGPKQFLELGSKPVLIHTLSALAGCPELEALVVAAPPELVSETVKLIGRFGVGKVQAVLAGGQTRQESVILAAEAVDEAYNYLLIHDGVRPFVDQKTIRRVMEAALEVGAATAGLPSHDTLAEVDRKMNVTSMPQRSRVWQIQTPQGFWRPLLEKAQKRAQNEDYLGTDETGLALRMGRQVRVVEGSPLNFKLTTPQDLRMAQAFLGLVEERL